MDVIFNNLLLCSGVFVGFVHMCSISCPFFSSSSFLISRISDKQCYMKMNSIDQEHFIGKMQIPSVVYILLWFDQACTKPLRVCLFLRANKTSLSLNVFFSLLI